MYVSLQDVAARAGVSFQTAGKVLNNSGVTSTAALGRDPPARSGSGPMPPAPASRSLTHSPMLPHRKDDA